MKEIIKRLENMQLFITMQFEVEKGKKKQLELNKDFQALNIAISALEKQIPKKLKSHLPHGRCGLKLLLYVAIVGKR